MNIALITTATALGLIAAASASGKLTANPKIMESMHSVGVKDPQVRVLAALELLGAAGLLIGIAVPALGIAAAGALALYFLGALGSHLRMRHPAAAWAPAFVITVLAIAATVLQLQR